MKKTISMLLIISVLVISFGMVSVTAMSSADLDAGLQTGINYFNNGLYYEARDEFQWFCDANWQNLNDGQQDYALDWLNSAKDKVAEYEAKHIVLLLDNTGSSSYRGSTGRIVYTTDTAVEYVKDAAKKFVNDIYASGNKQYVSVVSFNEYPTVLCEFTNDSNKLIEVIDKLADSGAQFTDMAEALQAADNIMQNTYTAGDKHLVMFTTGSTGSGEYRNEGRYSESAPGSIWMNNTTGINAYKYANRAHEVADIIKSYGKIYTVGIFQTMAAAEGEVLPIAEFYKINTRDLASSPDYFYPVEKADQLSAMFTTVAEDIQLNPSIWAKAEITEAKNAKLIPETLKGQDLSKTVTRGEFAAITLQLYEALMQKSVESAPDAPFTDIFFTEDRDAINKAYLLNIIQGVSDTMFVPAAKITREDLATMLCRTVKKYKFEDWSLATDNEYYLDTEGVKKYSDDYAISDYAKPSVYYLTKMGVLNGIGENEFAPKSTTSQQEAEGYATATREQAIILALRIFKLPNL